MSRRVPIGDYGLIGDTRSAALVAPDGSIDWWCVPRFDDPPLFGRLVGGDAAGWFVIGPAETAEVAARCYRADTATLTTTWVVDGGEIDLEDGLVAEVSPPRRLATAGLLEMLTLESTVRSRPRTVRSTDPTVSVFPSMPAGRYRVRLEGGGSAGWLMLGIGQDRVRASERGARLAAFADRYRVSGGGSRAHRPRRRGRPPGNPQGDCRTTVDPAIERTPDRSRCPSSGQVRGHRCVLSRRSQFRRT